MHSTYVVGLKRKPGSHSVAENLAGIGEQGSEGWGVSTGFGSSSLEDAHGCDGTGCDGQLLLSPRRRGRRCNQFVDRLGTT
jgi:hypothetical protein